MNLQMNISLAERYSSPTQIAKALTENWILEQSYCPSCLNELTQAKSNSKVLDFTCEHCKYEFELKSKKGNFGQKITDGAYDTMIERLAQSNSPHFFFLSYSTQFKVENLTVVPSYFMQSSCIEKRKPLSPNARRAGWVGCNILAQQIPEVGRIVLIKNSRINDREQVRLRWLQTNFLALAEASESRGWIIDILNCIERLDSRNFSLDQIYQFEAELAQKHPRNSHVKDKIRQQLQALRDKGLLEFISRGKYRLVKDAS